MVSIVELVGNEMVPAEIFAEDVMSTIIRYSLYLGAAFQILCMLACITMNDEHSEPAPNDNMVIVLLLYVKVKLPSALALA